MGMEIIISVVLLLVGIAVLVIIHVCIVGRTFSRNNLSNSGVINVVQRSINRSSSMSQDDIKKLPSFNYMVGDQKEDEEKEIHRGGDGGSSNHSNSLEMECVVCLENFKVGEKCRLLPKCNHCFHAECIDSWLLKTAVCPICRTGTISPLLDEHDRNHIEVGVEFV